MMGNCKDALVDAVKATEVRPDYSMGYFCKAMVYHTLGQLDKALENYNIAIKLNPADENSRRYKQQILEIMKLTKTQK